MKTEMNAQTPVENNTLINNQSPGPGGHSTPRLSDQAFYLIVLDKLFKKEFGVTVLKQFMKSPENSQHLYS